MLAELKLPKSKLSSLTAYARKYRHRRILAPTARLEECLSGGVSALGPDCVKLLGMMIAQALTDESKVQRTAQVLGEFVDRVGRMAQRAEEAEAQGAAKDKRDGKTGDIAATLERIAADVFGIRDGDTDGN